MSDPSYDQPRRALDAWRWPPRDPDRIPEVLAEVERLWRANPDLRLGQIVGNVAGILGKDPYFMEDDELLDRLRSEAA